MNRRRFFREGLAELLKPLGRHMAPLARLAEEVGKLDAPAATPILPAAYTPATGNVSRGSTPVGPILNDNQVFLRPPGMQSEEAFVNTCSRCGHCETACPVQAIKIDWNGAIAGGLPYIDADTQPCIMCDGLHCMRQCPSGALQEVAAIDIDMGTAQWDPNTCLRSAGQPCTDCIDHCPIGNLAIELKNNEIHVIEDGCTGCGSCQHACPSVPKSIVVIPHKDPEPQPMD